MIHRIGKQTKRLAQLLLVGTLTLFLMSMACFPLSAQADTSEVPIYLGYKSDGSGPGTTPPVPGPEPGTDSEEILVLQPVQARGDIQSDIPVNAKQNNGILAKTGDGTLNVVLIVLLIAAATSLYAAGLTVARKNEEEYE